LVHYIGNHVTVCILGCSANPSHLGDVWPELLLVWMLTNPLRFRYGQLELQLRFESCLGLTDLGTGRDGWGTPGGCFGDLGSSGRLEPGAPAETLGRRKWLLGLWGQYQPDHGRCFRLDEHRFIKLCNWIVTMLLPYFIIMLQFGIQINSVGFS
jgi:hypothetical protein